jgi:hypothetical protein
METDVCSDIKHNVVLLCDAAHDGLFVNLPLGAWPAGRKCRDGDDEFERVNRLHEVHLKPAGQRCDPILRSRVGRESRGWNASRGVLQLSNRANELKAVHSRHSDVGDEDIEKLVANRVERLRSRTRCRYRCPRTFQYCAQQIERVRGVVHRKNVNAIEAGNRVKFRWPTVRLRMLSLVPCRHRLMNNHQWQLNGERRALIRSATGCRNRASVKFGQLLGDRKAETETPMFSSEGGIGLTEPLEDEWQEVRGNASPGVTDGYFDVRIHTRQAQLHLSPARCELDRVG